MNHDDTERAIDTAASSPWFIPKLLSILLIASFGSGLLWHLMDADHEARASWASYRDANCTRESIASVGRETWLCGHSRYTARTGSAPLEFQTQQLRAQLWNRLLHGAFADR